MEAQMLKGLLRLKCLFAVVSQILLKMKNYWN